MKHFPLQMHPFARLAASASIAAQKQGKFWAFHDLLFANYRSLSNEKIHEIAKKVSLDMAQFDASLKDPEISAMLNRDVDEGNRLGVRGTPTVFINGKRLGNRSMDGFNGAIRTELNKRGSH